MEKEKLNPRTKKYKVPLGCGYCGQAIYIATFVENANHGGKLLKDRQPTEAWDESCPRSPTGGHDLLE